MNRHRGNSFECRICQEEDRDSSMETHCACCDSLKGWVLGDDIALPMTKTKRRLLLAREAKKDTLSNSRIEVKAQVVDDDWVVVKKKRIIIHIPPLPMAVKPVPKKPRMKKRIQRRSRKTAKSQARNLNKQCLEDAEINDKKSPPKEEKKASDVTPDPKSVSEERNPDEQPRSQPFSDNAPAVNRNKHQELAGVPGFSNRQPFSAIWTSDYRQRTRGLKDDCEFRLLGGLSMGALQNQNVRAFNLERKLERAGGLSRWLISQGLDRFVEMFRREKIDRFQLLGLTMGRLKDMGANAVGPRRKLIHAIDCLCQPYYFKVLP